MTLNTLRPLPSQVELAADFADGALDSPFSMQDGSCAAAAVRLPGKLEPWWTVFRWSRCRCQDGRGLVNSILPVLATLRSYFCGTTEQWDAL